VSLSYGDWSELEQEGFLETDFRMVGTNVDMGFADDPIPATLFKEVMGAAGGKTCTLSRWDTLKTWPGEKGSIRGVDVSPPEGPNCKVIVLY